MTGRKGRREKKETEKERENNGVSVVNCRGTIRENK